MYLSRRRTLSLLVSLPLAGMGISACGGFGTTANSADAMKLKAVQNSNSLGYFPLYVAQQQDLFKANNLTLDPAVMPQLGTGPKTTAAIESNSVELAAGVITDTFTLSRVDAQIKLLGAVTTGLNVDLVLSKGLAQQTGLTITDPLSDRLKALTGKKIGVTGIGAATEAFLIYLFRQQGLDAKKEVVIVNLGGSNTTAGLAALRAGRVDALSFPSPIGLLAEMQGIGTTFVTARAGQPDVPEMQGFVNIILYAKQSVIDAKPLAVQAFIRSVAQAQAFIHSHPDQATELMGKYLKYDKKTLETVAPVMLPSFLQTPIISQQAYDISTSFHVKGGLIAVAPLYNTIVATSTIDSALKS